VIEGEVAPGFEPVRDAAARALEAQGGGGLAVAAFLHGRPVVDVWGGTVGEDGLVHTWSACKPVTGACALLLVERGRLSLDEPTRHVLTHAAGRDTVPGGDVARLVDWDATCAALAAAEPDWPPGTAVGEHALTYGHLVGELVRAADPEGRSLGRFLEDEIGVDVHIGLDDGLLRRVVDLDGVTDDWWDGRRGEPGTLRHRALGDGVTAALVNGEAWRRAEVPAVNAHASARGLATFWQRFLDGTLPAAVGEPGASGPDLVLDRPVTWTLAGGQLDGADVGMGGVGGQWGAARPADGLAWAFLTTVMGDFDRADAVERALLGCVGR
jgi:CubicO group peptidase (beta-lactamase class C family)